MTGLPDAVLRCPHCGACGAETTSEDGYFACYDCLLMFDRAMEASFLDPDAEPCGEPCDNSWHKPGAIKQGYGFACHPCRLPKGHASEHWTGCESIWLDGSAP